MYLSAWYSTLLLQQMSKQQLWGVSRKQDGAPRGESTNLEADCVLFSAISWILYVTFPEAEAGSHAAAAALSLPTS